MPDVLRAALECADDGVVIVDDAHRITHFNAAAERIWKLARTEVLGRDADILALKCLQAPTADFRDEISLIRPDGSRIRATIALSPAIVDGAVHHIVFARDVTAEADRRARIKLLDAVSDQTNRAVIITDVEQNIRYVEVRLAPVLQAVPERGFTIEAVLESVLAGLEHGRRDVQREVAPLGQPRVVAVQREPDDRQLQLDTHVGIGQVEVDRAVR
jgi:PAS domain S-box-containing protein